MLRTWICVLLFFCCLLVPAKSFANSNQSKLPSANQLPANVLALLKKVDLPNSALSVLILPANQDMPLLSNNADKPTAPASTLKLLTSFIALDELGPNFRWKTQFLSESPIKKETLTGNLYLRGGGDPNLTWDKLSIMLRTLRQQGLRDMQGDIVLDRSYFQPNRPELNAPNFDENPDAYYNVIPDALLIHSNITAFAINTSNDKVEAQLNTPMDKVILHNQIKLNDRPCSDWEKSWQAPKTSINDQGQIDITLSGSFPKGCQTTTYLNIIERNVYIGSVIRALWKELGGNWEGKIIDGQTPASATLLTERQSDTLSDTIRIVNKFSDNSMARILFLTLGAESPLAKNFADTNQAANAEVRAWFAKNGINDAGLVIENGSGLSRLDRISASQLAHILQLALRSNWLPEFSSSLPIVGVDGTMRKRLKGSNAEGRARIKTGYLKNVMAVAGYVRDVNDADWVVVAIINSDNIPASKGKPALDELINWVANGRP
jgi:D-alanyl-D-alanine carboxypeptidase/D-alanyl-D-alanine-endopeptidase (penicillin-binding protein 4)